SESGEGDSKAVTIDANPSFEAFEKESRHATLWLMIANRYSLQIELQNQDPKELQQWSRRVDLKKLAAIKESAVEGLIRVVPLLAYPVLSSMAFAAAPPRPTPPDRAKTKFAPRAP